MQISAQTLLASQQAAQAKAPVRPAPGFAAAPEKSEGFAPLPLKQAALTPENPVSARLLAQPQAARPGTVLDIRV